MKKPIKFILYRVLIFKEDFIFTGIFQDFPEPPAPLIEVIPRAKNGSLFHMTENFLFSDIAPTIFFNAEK